MQTLAEKSLAEMTRGELERLKADVARSIRAARQGGDPGELFGFLFAVHHELDRRGA